MRSRFVLNGADGWKLGAIHKFLVGMVGIASGRGVVKAVLEGIFGEKLSVFSQRGSNYGFFLTYLKYAIELI